MCTCSQVGPQFWLTIIFFLSHNFLSYEISAHYTSGCGHDGCGQDVRLIECLYTVKRMNKERKFAFATHIHIAT